MMSEQRMYRVGVGHYSPPDDATITAGDLVQLDPVAFAEGSIIGTVMRASQYNSEYYEISLPMNRTLGVHRSWLHKVGRAKFWPNGTPVEDDSIAETVWGKVPVNGNFEERGIRYPDDDSYGHGNTVIS